MDAGKLIDIQAEGQLLGCVILDPRRVVPLVKGLVCETDFTNSLDIQRDLGQLSYGKVLDATIKLHEAGCCVDDIRILITELRKMGLVVNLAELARLVNSIVTVSSAVYYAERVRDLSRLRSLYMVAAKLSEKVTEDKADPNDIVDWMEGESKRVRNNAATESKGILQIWTDWTNRLEADLKANRQQALLSGFPGADQMGFVFAPGEMTVLAARPSVGKTAIATQIGMHHAKQGRSVLMVSMEMGGEELGARLLTAAAGKNHQLIRTGEYTMQTVNQLRVEAENIGERPFYVFDGGRVKVGVIHAAAAVMKASHGLAMLIVDYIGLVRPDDNRKPKHEQIGDITKGLRDIGKQLGVPVLALAQLNRQADGETPTLSMLKESGDIEQDADLVAFLHPNPEPNWPNKVDLIIAKNRQGTRGTVGLEWVKESTRFEDYSTGRDWVG